MQTSEEEIIERALAAGWTHIQYASDNTVHPMASGARSAVVGDKILPIGKQEILVGTQPGAWVDNGNGTGHGPSVDLNHEAIDKATPQE